MGRSHITPIRQPNTTTCGPTALKHALTALGKRKSLKTLINLCQTNSNGTSAHNMIKAVKKLQLPSLIVQYATLSHLQSALRYKPNQSRAVLVSYLYDKDEKNKLHPESGHWAMVSSFSARRSRVILLDSMTGKKKSYLWEEFRERWIDYDLKRKKTSSRGKRFRLVRKWQQQLMMVIASKPEHLPRFSIATAKMYAVN